MTCTFYFVEFIPDSFMTLAYLGGNWGEPENKIEEPLFTFGGEEKRKTVSVLGQNLIVLIELNHP